MASAGTTLISSSLQSSSFFVILMMLMKNSSIFLCSGLRICRFRSCGLGCSYSSNLIPGLGTSLCHMCSCIPIFLGGGGLVVNVLFFLIRNFVIEDIVDL